MSAGTLRAMRVEQAMVKHNDIAGKQLRSLCEVLGLQSCFPEYLLLQRFLFGAWGEAALAAAPAYASRIGDDHSPYEYSVAFSGREVELRLLCEAQASQP